MFRIKKFNIGIQLCYDSHFPELSNCMALGGADLIVIPHASPNGTPTDKHNSWMRHLPDRAFDTGVFIFTFNQVGSNGENLNFPDNPMVLSPSGVVLAKKTSEKEGLITTTIRKKELQEQRNHKMKYFLPNQRPSLYKTVPSIITLVN